ncbi:MAG: hypothetical protein LBD41_07620 [Clostridiales Family XIII bacterium]|jgi:hypothetical protein|nr:hypothetical protein [Clostridiales Family XIII bacterium]
MTRNFFLLVVCVSILNFSYFQGTTLAEQTNPADYVLHSDYSLMPNNSPNFQLASNGRNNPEVKLSDINRIFSDVNNVIYLDETGYDFYVFNIPDLIKAAVDYYKSIGVTIKIFNSATTRENPVDSFYIVYYNDYYRGIEIINPAKGNKSRQSAEVVYSFMCELEENYPGCFDLKIKNKGANQTMKQALRNNPIIIQLRKNISGQGRYKYNEVN